MRSSFTCVRGLSGRERVMKMGRPKYGSRSDGILTCFLPVYRSDFPYGRRITVREIRIDDNGLTAPMNIQLSVVKAYRRFVLFVDERNIKHTYTYQELVEMGYVS